MLVAIGGLGGCQCEGKNPVVLNDAAPPWDVAPKTEPSRKGMAWIPAGVLIAGTPPGQLPRIADEELPGKRITMGGFFIDRFNYPAEPGAIPRSGITQSRARAICEEQGKRLCSELEWERACKGTANSTYEYGDSYDGSVCGTGDSDSLAPNGVNSRCKSSFGVRDMHGSTWNWTSSEWGRGSKSKKKLVTLRGGNGDDGELIGRCANARGMHPNRRDGRVGVRCCAGEANAAAVALEVTRGSVLQWRPPDDGTAASLAKLVPAEIKQAVKGRPKADAFLVERIWMWRPIGNEELTIGGGCARPPGHNACGVVIVRRHGGKTELLSFASSGFWIPTIGEHEASRTVYLYGGDQSGAYRKPVIYEWGRIGEGGKERKRRGGWLKP